VRSVLAAGLVAWCLCLQTTARGQDSAREPESLETLVRQALAEPLRPPVELMRREDAGLEVLRQMGPELRDAQAGHLRLLAWVGDRRGVAPVEKLLEGRAVDRTAAVRTLVALDAPGMLERAHELFEDEPPFGAPLLARCRSPRGAVVARRLLAGEDPRGWLPAIWVLGQGHDSAEIPVLEERSRVLPPLDKETHQAIQIAVRRLRIENRDIPSEALWEYLSDIQDRADAGGLNERLWCLVELGRLGDASAVTRLAKGTWLGRSRAADVEGATILWARHHAGDSLSPVELERLRQERFRLTYIPGGSRWPPELARPGR
jgi:hypothetical protein